MEGEKGGEAELGVIIFLRNIALVRRLYRGTGIYYVESLLSHDKVRAESGTGRLCVKNVNMKKIIVWLVAVSALTMPVLAERTMPRNVDPAVGGGVRYEAPHRLPRVGLIEAWDEQSGRKLWEQKVYEVRIDPKLEEDVQWDFIARLRLQGNELLITTESGKAYTLDVMTRKVTEIRPVLQLQNELKNLPENSILDIREPAGGGWVQISRDEPNPKASFQLFFPSRERPEKAFSAVGMTLPKTWEIVEFSFSPTSPSESSCLFSIPNKDVVDILPHFLDDYFIKFLKRPSTYKLSFERIQ